MFFISTHIIFIDSNIIILGIDKYDSSIYHKCIIWWNKLNHRLISTSGFEQVISYWSYCNFINISVCSEIDWLVKTSAELLFRYFNHQQISLSGMDIFSKSSPLFTFCGWCLLPMGEGKLMWNDRLLKQILLVSHGILLVNISKQSAPFFSIVLRLLY